MRRFGMDRLGEVIAARPRMVAALCFAVTIGAALAFASGIKFNGDVSAVLKGDTPGYRALHQVETAFHPFSTDEVLVVEAPDLGSGESYTALEELVSELQLVDGVAAVMSVFSLPQAGQSDPFLSTPEAGNLAPAQRLDTLLERQPLAANMLSKDRTTSLVVIMVRQVEGAEPARLSRDTLADITEIARAHEPALSSGFVGMAAIHRVIEDALKSDQKLLATVSTALCVILALVLFRSWRDALICAIPPIIGTGWFFGFAAIAGITIDTITTIIPTLLIVVGFADAVHLHFAWLRARKDGATARQAIASSFASTAPACFLTSATTAIACLGIGLAGSASLNTFAWAGFAGMFIQFAAVMTLVPMLALVLGSAKKAGPQGQPMQFSALGAMAIALLSRARLVVAVSVALFALLVAAQWNLQNGFSLSEHLRAGSSLRQLEQRLVASGLGSGQLFVMVDDSDGKKGISAQDNDRIALAAKAIFPKASQSMTTSLFPTAGQIEKLSQGDQPILRRFVSHDALHYLLPVPVDLSLTSTQIAAKADDMRSRLAAVGLGEATVVTGLPLLSATEVPRMIDDLRLGFYIALVLVIAVLVYATRSWRLGLLSLMPNLIPILGVEAWLWLTSQQMSMTAAVALTIAFGIAVDDSIHVFNRYQQARAAGLRDAVRLAIAETAPPITASTILLVAGLSVTQASSLPSVAVFGQLVIASLVLALFASLFLLPSFLKVFVKEETS